MKKTYKTAQLEVVMFDQTEVIIASAVTPEASTDYNKDDDETEML